MAPSSFYDRLSDTIHVHKKGWSKLCLDQWVGLFLSAFTIEVEVDMGTSVVGCRMSLTIRRLGLLGLIDRLSPLN